MTFEQLLLILALGIPFVTGIIDLIYRHTYRFQHVVTLSGATLSVVVAFLLLGRVATGGPVALQSGGWEAPFGITLVADTLSAIMVTMGAMVYWCVTVFSVATIDKEREHFGYYSLVSFLVMGVTGAFITGDAFNLYVWFELLLLSSFVLTALGNERTQLEGAVKYLTVNLISSFVFLVALGLLYRLAGTLNMADLAVQLANHDDPGLVTTVGIMFMIAFSIKAAAFPLYFWLPAAYPTPPIGVTTLFSGLLTKVGVYALLRFFTLIFTQDVAYTHTIILVGSGLTMVFGVLGAVAQMEVRRLLSFHIVSQIGYLLMGLGLFTQLSLTGTIFFMVHVIIAKSALFLVAGVANSIRGSYHLKKLGGLYNDFPWLAVMFLLPALALGGIPPFSGFWAKFTLVRSGLEVESYGIVIVSLVVSVLTLFSMTKIFAYAYWTPDSRGESAPSALPASLSTMLIPVVILGALTLILGIAAQPLFDLSSLAAEQLMNPQAYLDAVGVVLP